MSAWARTILHADMDAFYAAVEQLDHPPLRGRPVLVGSPSGRGVVCTASYEARPFGVGSAMPMAQARRRCPDAVIVPPRFDRYERVSAAVMDALGSFSPLVEPLSLDEAFLDLSGIRPLEEDPREAGEILRKAIREVTGGLTVSVGVASCKYIAKVASDHRKPDGLTVVSPEEQLAFLHPLPVRCLWGIGPRGQDRLADLGLSTIGDVAQSSREQLARSLGSLGEHIWRLAHAIDPREVVPHRDPGSVGSETTLERDIRGPEAAMPHLRRAADRVARRLRGQGHQARGIRVKLKTASFRLMSRQRTLASATDTAADLLAGAKPLLPGFDFSEPLRLVGLAAYDLLEAHTPTQGLLFGQEERQAERRLEKAMDSVRERFGSGSLKRGSDLRGESPTV